MHCLLVTTNNYLNVGYPLCPWLLTPFENPLPHTPEERCNNRLKTRRCLIERCNSKLKNRFRCLIKHRVLHYTPDVAARIINACVVLHNNAVNIEDMGIIENEIPPAINHQDIAAARQLSQQIAENHF